jgi:hypothetical protein
MAELLQEPSRNYKLEKKKRKEGKKKRVGR